MKKLSLLTVFLLSAALSFAQDMLIKRSGEAVPVKVLEVTPEIIKYKRFDNQDGPIISIQKQDVTEIKYENGTIERIEFAPMPVKPENPKPQFMRRNALSLNVLPIVAQSFNVFYDRRLSGNPNIALSFGAGVYIHPEDFFSPANDQFSLTGAAKFYIQESGFYLSPYLKYRHVSHTQRIYQGSYQSTFKNNWNQFGGGATFGMQHTFKSGFLIDSFMGLGGYAIENNNQRSGEDHYFQPSDLDVRLGIALGFAF